MESIKAVAQRAWPLTGSGTRRKTGNSSLLADAAWLWLAGFAQIVAYAMVSSLGYVDYDDRMRAVQLRELVATDKWFDLTLHALAMPETYVSPWSRLVDAPYYLFARGIAPLIGADQALQTAQLVVPPMLFALFCVPAVHVMRTIVGRPLRPLHLLVASLVMSYAIKSFTFGRIDHHNFQMILMMAMLAGWCLPDRRKGGVLAGLAVVLSVAVGLECVPFVALGLAVMGLMAALGNREAGESLQWTGLAMMAGVPLAGFALIGPAAIMSVQCDALSAPWLSGLFLTGAVLAGARFAWQRLAPQQGVTANTFRLGMLGLPFLAVAGGLAVAFPACTAGPYGMIDPVSRTFWLARVPQEMSVLSYIAHRQNDVAISCAMIAMVAIAASPIMVAALRRSQSGVVVAYVLAVCGFMLALAQLRFVAFPAAFGALFVPAIITGPHVRLPRLRAIMFAAVLVPALALAIAYVAVPKGANTANALDLMDLDECKSADFSVLDDVAPGRIMAPVGLAFPIVERQNRHAVAALFFHRASPGIRRMALAFTARDAGTRREALAPFDYVAVCERPDIAIDLSDAPLFEALARGRDWPGLVPVGEREAAAPGDPHFRLYRVDHANLR